MEEVRQSETDCGLSESEKVDQYYANRFSLMVWREIS